MNKIKYTERVFKFNSGTAMELDSYLKYCTTYEQWFASILQKEGTSAIGLGSTPRAALQNLRSQLAQATTEKLKGKNNE